MAGATSTLTTNNNNSSNKTNGNGGGHGVSLSRGDDITSMDREGGDLFSFDKRELLFGGDMDHDDGEDGEDQNGIISYNTLSFLSILSHTLSFLSILSHLH